MNTIFARPLRTVSLRLKDLNRIVTVKDDTWNGFKKSEYIISYQDSKGEVANTVVRTATGQIGWIWSPKSLEEEILFDIVDVLSNRKNPPMNIWEVTSNTKNKLYLGWGFTWKKPVHYTVTGGGFSQNLQHLIIKKALGK